MKSRICAHIRFYEQLDKRIEIRHHENQSQMGVYVDGEVGIQIVHSETNPTGRGKEDAASHAYTEEFKDNA